MRIATWNINSVRLRLGLVERFLEETRPDILCLQETKTVNETFPSADFAAWGYKHQHILGMKSYNGVAILSRLPFTKKEIKNWQQREDCRHIYVELSSGVEVHCCYVPAGGDIPDPAVNSKFAHKLGFLDEQAQWWRSRRDRKHPTMLLGDFNVAPLENDVWSHRQMLNIVSHTPIEIEKMEKWQAAFSFYDATRHFVPESEKLYSWWSYRAHDWEQSDRGRRLDHIWLTPNLISSLKKSKIYREARGWKPKPSDHVPVLVEIG